MEIKKNQNILEISGLPSELVDLNEIQNCFNRLAEVLHSGHFERMNIDLAGVRAINYPVLTLLISIGDLCFKKSLKVFPLNWQDEDVKNAVEKLGFDMNGLFKPLQFREDKPESVFISLGEGALDFWYDMKKLTGFIGEVFKAIFFIIRNPRKLDMKETLFYMDKSGVDAVPIVMMICFLVGLILAFQGIAQMANYGLAIMVADLVALSVVRELGPLMVAMICIGRAGSAYAAELGTMKVSEEIDAMDTMGLKPARFLVIPKLIALVVVMPMLVVIGDISGIIGGVIIGVSMSDITLIEYFNRTLESLIPANVVESLVKSLFFALIIAAVGCYRGFEADRDAKGVGKAATSAVVSGIFMVIVADFFVTFAFPQVLALLGIKY